MRLRTLPVSISGVLGGICVAIAGGFFAWLPALICMLFALSAQITSNFANEYFDFINGLDRPGRDGFRRGVAEGDISARAMGKAVVLMLSISAILGLSLIWWGGLWLILAGAIILIGAVAYSGGPWPLSHHGLGDVAVIIFYGLVPVFFTAWLQAEACGIPFDSYRPDMPLSSWAASICMGASIGLMGMDVLIVNNYRDMEDDRAAGKRTTAVIFGRKTMGLVYLIAWIIADILILISFDTRADIVAFSAVVPQIMLWRRLRRKTGAALNNLLRDTSLLLLTIVLMTLVCVIFRT